MRFTKNAVFRSRLKGPFGALLIGVATLFLSGCNADSHNANASTERRSNVVPPSVAITPSEVQLAPGETTVFKAHTHGGEAMLFSVDWKIREGSQGGTIASSGTRTNDGVYSAVYIAPTAGGSFHVEATIHEFPAANISATVHVVPQK